MEKPKSPEKNREYFINELERLSNEAVQHGETGLAVILHSTTASLLTNQEDLVADACANTSKAILASLTANLGTKLN